MNTRLIGPVDTIWLNMDRPNNLMVIDSLMLLDGPADWDRLVEVARVRMVERYPVFRQRPVLSRTHVGPPHWEDDPDFDLERHVVRAQLAGSDDRALQQYVAEQSCVPLDRGRPLWQMHLLDGYGAGAVVYCRLHHALADGIALARVLLSLTDPTAEAETEAPVPAAAADPEPHLTGLLDGALQVVAAAASAASAVASLGVQTLREAPRLLDPRLLDPHVLGDAFTQAERTPAIAQKLILGKHPHLPFNGTPGIEKRVAWCEPFPLDAVKAVGASTGATVNDVLVAAVAGALRAYATERGGTPVDVATMVPVNVRPLDRPLPRNLGNQFALVLLNLPLSVADPVERIAEVKRRMDRIKHSPEVMLTFGLIKAIGRTGPELERYFVDFFADKAIGVTTNVPGPTEPRYLAGSRIDRVLAWPPESGDQSIGISIWSYAGQVYVGFKVDAGLVPDPGRLVAAFDAEFAELTGFTSAR